MIEPLRFNREKGGSFPISNPVLCEVCITHAKKERRQNPELATLYCVDCLQKRFLCRECDDGMHRFGAGKGHLRKIIVLGPGLRKNIIIKGDGYNIPLPLDEVEILLESSIFHDGHMIHSEPLRKFHFMTGLSGKSIHVQVLGCKNLIAADSGGTSDPYVSAYYSGKQLGNTRVRPRALNPQWNNESFIIPMDPNLADPRNLTNSSREMFKLEVYDYDFIGYNDFLGHVEIPRAKLLELAISSKEHPICLPLTLREFHGLLGIRIGVCDRYIHIKIQRGESLDKANAPWGLSDPYAILYMGPWLFGQTPAIEDTIDPEWKEGNIFRIKINDFLKYERKFVKKHYKKEDKEKVLHQEASQITVDKDSTSEHEHSQFNGEDIEIISPEETDVGGNVKEDDSFFRIEIFDENTFRAHVHLGTVRIKHKYIRRMAPTIPKHKVEVIPLANAEEILWEAMHVLDMTVEPEIESGFFATKLKSCFKKPPDDDSDDNDEDAANNSLQEDETIETENDEDNSDDGVEDPIYAMINSEIEQNSYSGEGLTGVVGKRDQYDDSYVKISNNNSVVSTVDNTANDSETNTVTSSRQNSIMTQVDEDGNVINTQNSIEELDSKKSKKDSDDEDDDDDDDDDEEPDMKSKIAKYWDSMVNKSKEIKDKLTYSPANTAVWSYLRHFAVELESCNNVAEPDETERGYVVVRLISATRGNVIAGLDEGIRTMTLGETSKIKIRYDYAYASYYMGSSIPPRANIVFTVNLLQINGSGRLGMPIRQVKRYAEKVYKLFLRTRKKIRITNRYFKKHQPIYTFYRKAKAILTCEKVIVDDESEEFLSSRGSDYTDDESSEKSVEEEEIVEKRFVDKRMSQYLTKSVTSGAKYLLSWKPEKRPPKMLKVKAIKATKAIKELEVTSENSIENGGEEHNSLIKDESNFEDGAITEVVDDGSVAVMETEQLVEVVDSASLSGSVVVKETKQLLELNDFVPDPKDAIYSKEETNTDSAPTRTAKPKPKPPDEINV